MRFFYNYVKKFMSRIVIEIWPYENLFGTFSDFSKYNKMR
jgi:hypothetical protein